MELNLWSLLAVDMTMRVIFLGGLFHCWLTYPSPVIVVGVLLSAIWTEYHTLETPLRCIMDGPTNVHPYSPSPWKGVPAAVMSESMRKIFHQRLLEVDCWLGVCYIRTRTVGGLLPRMHRTNWKFMRFPCCRWWWVAVNRHSIHWLDWRLKLKEEEGKEADIFWHRLDVSLSASALKMVVS